MSRPPGRWRRRPHEDPHRRSDETPAPITRARFTSSRPPAATTRTPSTFGPARIRPTGPGPGRGGLRNSSSAQRDPGAGARMGRDRLAQCEPSATQSTPPRAVRAQRDEIHLRSIRASPPRTMRPRGDITKSTPQRRGSGGRRPGSRSASSTPPKRRHAGGTHHSHGAVGRLPQGRERADGRHPSHVEAELHSIHSTITFAVSAPLFQPCIGCIDQRRIDVRS